MDNRELGRKVGQSARRAQDVAALMFVLEAQAENSRLDEITMLEHCDLFPLWDENYTAQNRLTIVQDEGKLYRNIHPILDKSQNIKPSTDTKNQMWQLIGNPADEYPMWVKPLGAHDAYAEGTKVSHNGKKWISTHPGANTWEPGVYGWKEAA